MVPRSPVNSVRRPARAVSGRAASMYRVFFHNLYVGAKTDPMKSNHDPRQVAKLVSGLANGELASLPQHLCRAFYQGCTFGCLFGWSHFGARRCQPTVHMRGCFVPGLFRKAFFKGYGLLETASLHGAAPFLEEAGALVAFSSPMKADYRAVMRRVCHVRHRTYGQFCSPPKS
jgi:hypothetical protein